jgi:hypothetical protein
VGDFNFGRLYRFRPTPARDGLSFVDPGLADLVLDAQDDPAEIIFGTGFGGITDLKVGPDGRLYVLSFQGKIFALSQASAALQGLVTDQVTGAALDGVLVRGRRLEPPPAVQAHTRTDAAGAYTLGALAPGRYSVFLTRSGYGAQWRHVQLLPGEIATLDVQLPPR